jgi:hypothetical protein
MIRSRRILNDLRSIRRLLFAERGNGAAKPNGNGLAKPANIGGKHLGSMAKAAAA